jgi:hypothetical protein
VVRNFLLYYCLNLSILLFYSINLGKSNPPPQQIRFDPLGQAQDKGRARICIARASLLRIHNRQGASFYDSPTTDQSVRRPTTERRIFGHLGTFLSRRLSWYEKKKKFAPRAQMLLLSTRAYTVRLFCCCLLPSTAFNYYFWNFFSSPVVLSLSYTVTVIAVYLRVYVLISISPSPREPLFSFPPTARVTR